MNLKCNSAHSNSIGRNLSPAPEKNPESVADIIYFGPRKKSRLLFFGCFRFLFSFFSTVVLHFRWRIICPDAQSPSSHAPPPPVQMISKLIFHKKPERTSIKSSDWWRSQFSTRCPPFESCLMLILRTLSLVHLRLYNTRHF